MQPQTTELWENESHFRTLTMSPIKVTQQHIDNGKQRASGKCALALAFNDKMRDKALLHDHPTLWHTRVYTQRIRTYDSPRKRGIKSSRLQIELSEAIQDWVRKFDIFGPDKYNTIKPITIKYNPKKEQFEIQT